MLHKIKISFAVFCCLLMLLLSTSTAFASVDEAANDSSIYIDSLDMSIDLPENMLAVTRTSDSSEPYFTVFSESYDETMSYLKSADAYLVGRTLDNKITLIVTMTRDDNSMSISSYNELKNAQLETVKESYMSSGMYTECQTYKYSGVTFLEFLMNYSDDGTPVNGICCNTVVNGMIINLTFATAQGEPTAEEKEVIHSIMGTVSFGNGPAATNIVKIIIGVAVFLVLAAVVVVIVVLVKKYKSPEKKHERLMSRLNEEYGFNENQSYDEADYYDSLESDSFDEALLGDEQEELTGEDYEVDFDGEEEKEPEEIEEQEYTEVEPAPQQPVDKKTTGLFSKLSYKPEHLAKEDEFETSADYFDEMYDDEIDGSETVDSFYEEDEKKNSVSKKLSSVKDGAVILFASIAAGVKYFCVHMGYFCTNLSRAIKRSIRKKKAKSSAKRRPQSGRSGSKSRPTSANDRQSKRKN